jgi:hypothetical protein
VSVRVAPEQLEQAEVIALEHERALSEPAPLPA